MKNVTKICLWVIPACFLISNTVLDSAHAGPTQLPVRYVSGHISSSETWSADTVYWINADLYLDYGAILTLPAGTVVKFEYKGSLEVRFFVSGLLDLQGTAENPVYFTSSRDDSLGGDSNGDGSATSPAPGDWGNIKIHHGDNVFRHAVVRYGGKYAWKVWTTWYFENYCVWVYACDATVDSNEISYPYHYGVYLTSSAGTISNNTITDFVYGIACDNSSPTIEGNVLKDARDAMRYAFLQINSSFPTYSGNSMDSTCYPAIAVYGTISGIGTWVDVEGWGWPYVLTSDLTIGSGGKLTLPAGTVVKFEYQSHQHNRRRLFVSGILELQGAAGDPVYFTSSRDDSLGGDSNGDGNATSPAPADWGYIRIDNGANVFRHCVVKYGGYKDDDYGSGTAYRNYAIWVYACDATVDSNEISYPYHYGVYLTSSAGTISNNTITDFVYGIGCDNSSPTIEGNVLKDARDAMRYAFLQINSSFPTYSGNSMDSTCYPAIAVYGTISGIGTWVDVEGRGWPYVVISDLLTIGSGGKLTLPAGTVVKFEYQSTNDYKRRLFVYGILELQGTVENPVYFTSSRDDSLGGDSNADGNATSPAAGDWGYILIDNGDNIFKHAVVRYGGRYEYYSSGWKYHNYSVWVYACDATVDSNEISHPYQYGVYLTSSSGTVSGNTILDFSYGIATEYGSPMITDNQLTQGKPSSSGILIGRSSNATVAGNSISDCGSGVQLHGYQNEIPHVILANCTIENNDLGVYLWTDGGSYLIPEISLKGNNISNNSEYDFYAGPCSDYATTLDATYNWWGSTDSSYIASKIYDHEDSSTCPTVSFIPYSQGENGGICPSDFNYTGRVDGFDLAILGVAFGSIPGDDDWNPACNLSIVGPSLNRIDGFDLAIFGSQFGRTGCEEYFSKLWTALGKPQGELVVSYPIKSFDKGELAEVVVAVREAQDLFALAFVMEFNAEGFQLESLEKERWLSDEGETEVTLFHKLRGGKAIIGLTRLDGSVPGATGDGNLMRIVLKCNRDNTLLSLKLKDVGLVNPIGVVNASVKVTYNEEGLTGTPRDFRLLQNYPNPFNASTWIKYELPKDCRVKIEIFNVLGQKIRTLVDGYEEQGTKAVEWDGKNDGTKEVASGVYYYRLRTEDFENSRKMLLLR